MKNPYWLADDCPNCGECDSDGAWKGARMSSSLWGHNYSCCSDKCGLEFANSPKRKAKDRAAINAQIFELRQQLRMLEQ